MMSLISVDSLASKSASLCFRLLISSRKSVSVADDIRSHSVADDIRSQSVDIVVLSHSVDIVVLSHSVDIVVLSQSVVQLRTLFRLLFRLVNLTEPPVEDDFLEEFDLQSLLCDIDFSLVPTR